MYDSAARLTSWTDPDGTVSYTYDANGNVLFVTDANGTITREYDKLNRVTKYTDTQGNTLQYTYDEVGNLITLTYPNGSLVHYDYNAADQLIKVTDWANRETHYDYDKNGRLISALRPNGTQMTRVYNEASQLKQQKDVVIATSEVISQFDFSYDKAGNITQELVIPPPQPPQLTVPTNMTYGLANRLATYNEEVVQFDADGNMIRGPLSGSMADLVFDSRNRLKNAGTTAYHYDAENQRIGVNQTRYVINSQPVLSQVLVRTKGNGEVTYYVYGLGLIGSQRAGNYFSYHYDLRGSTIALTSDIGQVVERYQYSPYGMLMYGDASQTPFLFNGMYGVMSDGNGLYYMRARYYHPEMRKFVNQDIVLGRITNGQSLNQFAYVNGNPVSYVDPEGKLGFLAGLAIVSAALFAYDIYSAITFDPSVYDFDSGAVVPTALPIVEDVIGGAAKVIQKGIGKACHIGSSVLGSGAKKTDFIGDGMTGCVIGTCALARTNFDRDKQIEDALTTWKDAAEKAKVSFDPDTLRVIEHINSQGRIREIFAENGMQLGKGRVTNPYELLFVLKGKILPGNYAVLHPSGIGGHLNFLKVDSAGHIIMYDTNMARNLSEKYILELNPFTVYKLYDME